MTGRALDRRLWLGAGVALALIMVVLTWLVVISPSRADSQQLRDDTESVRQQNAVLAGKTAALREQAEHRPELRDRLEAALTALPAETRLPELSRQLASQARSHSVSVVSISIGTPTPLDAAVAAPAPATETPESTETTEPVPAPVAVAPSLLVIPVTIVSEGPGLQQLRFLRDIQRVGPRRALVTDSSLDADDKSSSVRTSSTLTVTLNVFTGPMPAADRARLAELLGQDAPA